MILKSVGKLILVVVAFAFLILTFGEVGINAQEENEEGDSSGVLVKKIVFVRKFKTPDTIAKDKIAEVLSIRKHQLNEMLASEKGRLKEAPERTKANIKADRNNTMVRAGNEPRYPSFVATMIPVMRGPIV